MLGDGFDRMQKETPANLEPAKYSFQKNSGHARAAKVAEDEL
jgi:hypothetical protein